MGKYSLESYEKYKTVKIRPKPLSVKEYDTSHGRFEYAAFSWKELEPARGEYKLGGIDKVLKAITNPVLFLTPDLPEWTKDNHEACYAALIQKVGSMIDSDKRLAAVMISTLANSKEEWNAYIDSFGSQVLLADLQNEPLIRYLKERGRGFGLLVKCGEENWIECCEAFAKHHLQRVWKSYPVFLYATDEAGGSHIRREAFRWHAGMSNVNLGLGYNLALRRLTYPETVSGSGSLPLRFWFVNSGSSRIYRKFQLRLQLKQENVSHEFPLHAATHSWLTGDLVHNEIVHLQDIAAGTYSLGIALCFEDRSSLTLNIQNRQQDGFYEMGTIQVEAAREDPLKNIWDTYYPEGYYPLEDPQMPGQE